MKKNNNIIIENHFNNNQHTNYENEHGNNDHREKDYIKQQNYDDDYNNYNDNNINEYENNSKNKNYKNENNDNNDENNEKNNRHHRNRSRSPHYFSRRDREYGRDRYYGDRREDERNRREQQDIERDQRKIFACQIHPKCDERDIFKFFSNVGKVVDIQLIRDNRTFKSKGLCYVEFEDKSSVAHALSLSGQSLGGFAISVQLTQAEKNRAVQAAIQSAQSKPMKLYIAHIHPKVNEDDIRPLFMAFGEVLSLEIKKDHRGKSKGYGFVEFRREIDAISAMKKLDGLEILAQKIRVTIVDANQDTSRITRDAIPNVSGSAVGNGNNSTTNNTNVNASSSSNSANNNNNTYSSHIERLDEESGNGGLFLGFTSKLELMKKLGGGAMADTANEALKQTTLLNRQQLQYHINPNTNATSNTQQTTNNVTQQQSQPTSRCVLLRNMFDPTTEENPDFDLEIREDVMYEVKKFGELSHIYVDKTNREGLVYLKFKHVEHATRTINNLNGRRFGKNQIKAEYYNEQQYSRDFLDS